MPRRSGSRKAHSSRKGSRSKARSRRARTSRKGSRSKARTSRRSSRKTTSRRRNSRSKARSRKTVSRRSSRRRRSQRGGDQSSVEDKYKFQGELEKCDHLRCSHKQKLKLLNDNIVRMKSLIDEGYEDIKNGRIRKSHNPGFGKKDSFDITEGKKRIKQGKEQLKKIHDNLQKQIQDKIKEWHIINILIGPEKEVLKEFNRNKLKIEDIEDITV